MSNISYSVDVDFVVYNVDVRLSSMKIVNVRILIPELPVSFQKDHCCLSPITASRALVGPKALPLNTFCDLSGFDCLVTLITKFTIYIV